MVYTNLPLLLKKEDLTIDTFIHFWRRFYESDETTDKNYFDNLKPIGELTEDNIEKLFKWKNGMRLSDKKTESVNKIQKRLAEIKNKFEKYGNSTDELKEIFAYSKSHFFENGYIWNLFFLHVLKYETCPIADMYAYRAFNYISNGENELPEYDWDTYLRYMDFFNDIASKTSHKRKEIDEALWGFGRFLSSSYSKIITEGVP